MITVILRSLPRALHYFASSCPDISSCSTWRSSSFASSLPFNGVPVTALFSTSVCCLSIERRSNYSLLWICVADPIVSQAKAAFSVLTNPATRAQYDRDRLGYLYAHFKSFEQFPATATVGKNKSREDQIEIYAAVLKDHISDPVEEKKVKVHARLFQIRNELEEYKENSKHVQEEWATSSNQILRMSANALREVEICARADIEMLENELGDLRGQLPPKNIDGPPGRIASGQYGSDMGTHNKSKLMLAVNQRPPSIPRSPTIPVRLRTGSKFAVRVNNSSTGDSSSSTSRSESTMAIDDRIQKYLVGSVYSPTFYAPATFLDAVKGQHNVERIIARAKRQSLDPETLSDLASMKSDKLPKQAEKSTFPGFDPAAFPEYDPAIKQKKAAQKHYGDILKKGESSKRLTNIGETSECSETQCECDAPNITNTRGAQTSVSSESSSSSTSFPTQSPPGLGLIEYQQRFGCHVITEDAQEETKNEVTGSNKKSAPAKKKIQKPWVNINDSVSMPAHLSSTHNRTALHSRVHSVDTDNIDSPIDGPHRPFQRTSRAAPSAEFTPMGKLRPKKALSSISYEIMQQEHNTTQPILRKPSQTRERTAIVESAEAAVTIIETMEPKGTATCKESEIGKETDVTQETQDNDTKERDAALYEALERSVSRMKKEEAARALVQLSRHDEKSSESQWGTQNAGNGFPDDDTQPIVLRRTDVRDGGVRYGGPENGGGPQQGGIPYGYGLYDHTQQRGVAEQLHSAYPLELDETSNVIPTIQRRRFQEGYRTGSYTHQSYMERPNLYGAIGSEIKAMKEKMTQEENMAAMDEVARQQSKSAMEKAMKASNLCGNLSASRKATNDPFVD